MDMKVIKHVKLFTCVTVLYVALLVRCHCSNGGLFTPATKCYILVAHRGYKDGSCTNCWKIMVVLTH